MMGRATSHIWVKAQHVDTEADDASGEAQQRQLDAIRWLDCEKI